MKYGEVLTSGMKQIGETRANFRVVTFGEGAFVTHALCSFQGVSQPLIPNVMPEKSSLTTLISQYQKLCQYCDEAFTATFNAFRSHMRCARGCAACCILETVVSLEAYIIASYLRSSSPPPIHILQNKVADLSAEQCIFLHNNECTIYPVRPIICRTHGLPIIYPDRQGIDICPLNFTEFDLTKIDKRFLFDAERIAENLMRLNLAFCLMTEKKDSAGDRIPLHRLITGQWEWFSDT